LFKLFFLLIFLKFLSFKGIREEFSKLKLKIASYVMVGTHENDRESGRDQDVQWLWLLQSDYLMDECWFFKKMLFFNILCTLDVPYFATYEKILRNLVIRVGKHITCNESANEAMKA
jgi:hypothetical protein